MSAMKGTSIIELLEHEGLLEEWLAAQVAAGYSQKLDKEHLRVESTAFLAALREAVATGGTDPHSSAWAPVRAYLSELSRRRASQGFTPSETALFVFSLKQPLFARLDDAFGDRPDDLREAVWSVSSLFDQLGLWTFEEYQRGRDDVVRRQQQEMIELSTPVVKLWDGVLAVPLIGTLDSERTQVVMETLLQRIVDTNSAMAIIDITGVPTVDTLVAQHLLKTVAAARLMGADCIISGIRPQIAQTIVHLGLTLSEVTTKASMADAIAEAFDRLGFRIERQER
jgi:rsbT co-antagonist protein RsbR